MHIGWSSSLSMITKASRSLSVRPFIKVLEVGPRDGLQNEQRVLPVATRSELVHRLDDAGLRHIEVGSLVNYKKVPQMHSTLELLKDCYDVDAKVSVLVPNHKQLHQLPKHVDEIVLFVAASDTFNQRNINTNIEGAFKRFEDIISELKRLHFYNRISIRGSISCCWGCPYEGMIDPHTVVDIIKGYERLNVDMIDLCDTIGVASPKSVEYVLNCVYGRMPYSAPFSLHLHDTNGLAVESALQGVKMGIHTIHSSIAGLGGCPFSPTRAGNLDTVRLVEALHDQGYPTGIDEFKLGNVSNWIRRQL